MGQKMIRAAWDTEKSRIVDGGLEREDLLFLECPGFFSKRRYLDKGVQGRVHWHTADIGGRASSQRDGQCQGLQVRTESASWQKKGGGKRRGCGHKGQRAGHVGPCRHSVFGSERSGAIFP